jgi:DNA-binding transcriptional LysR family regulator
MNDRMAGLKVFVRVARAGSVSRAAEQLGISQPSASRLLSALERDLGVSLLTRSTRALSLTQAGADYLSQVEPIMAALETANQAVRMAKSELRGTLRIGIPISIAIREVIPRLPPFLKAHPSLRVDLVTGDAHQHLVRDGIDIAVRIGKLNDSAATYKRIGTNRRILVASPTYLSYAGTPRVPPDLAKHSIVSGPGPGNRQAWRFVRGDRKVSVRIHTLVSSNVNETAVAAAVNGLGIAPCGVWGCRSELESGTLVRVLEDWSLGAVPVHAVYPAGRASKLAARIFVDYLLAELRGSILAPPIHASDE